jgi:hypothetical protein
MPGHDGCASGCTGEMQQRPWHDCGEVAAKAVLRRSNADKTKRPAEVAGRLH